jgi:hypothetical protein
LDPEVQNEFQYEGFIKLSDNFKSVNILLKKAKDNEDYEMIDQSHKLPKNDPNKFKTKTSLSKIFK